MPEASVSSSFLGVFVCLFPFLSPEFSLIFAIKPGQASGGKMYEGMWTSLGLPLPPEFFTLKLVHTQAPEVYPNCHLRVPTSTWLQGLLLQVA